MCTSYFYMYYNFVFKVQVGLCFGFSCILMCCFFLHKYFILLTSLLICMPPRRTVGGHINLPLSVACPFGYRYMVCSAISSYSFGATALIFCRMFIHIMEVCMSTGFWFSHFWDRPVPIFSDVRFSYLALVQDKKITCVLPSNAYCTVYVNSPPPMLHAFSFLK